MGNIASSEQAVQMGVPLASFDRTFDLEEPDPSGDQRSKILSFSQLSEIVVEPVDLMDERGIGVPERESKKPTFGRSSQKVTKLMLSK